MYKLNPYEIILMHSVLYGMGLSLENNGGLRSNYLNNKAAIFFYYLHVQYIRSVDIAILIKILSLKIPSR